ncbi:hypothetical protein PGT21_008796 [Puccinia graminis f. sp. tritici]|uniref:Uncharacterized protein n=1 Tax=Puccinia graminis f. sp. tritici TaxID=56615 RepID=A0A5B0MT79_PUCGR|nr:hypothetical protein PGT21_008796 [Puccinia graminis f. sp. tritici]
MAPLFPSSNLNKKPKQKPLNYLFYQQHQLYRPVDLGRSGLFGPNRKTTLQPKPTAPSTQPSLPTASGSRPSHSEERDKTNSDHPPELAQIDDDDSRSTDSDPEIISQLLVPRQTHSGAPETSTKAVNHLDPRLTNPQLPDSSSDLNSRITPDDARDSSGYEKVLSPQPPAKQEEDEVDELEEDPTADDEVDQLEEPYEAHSNDQDPDLTDDRLSHHSLCEKVVDPIAELSSQHRTSREQTNDPSNPENGDYVENPNTQDPSQPKPQGRKTPGPACDPSSDTAPPRIELIIIDSDRESADMDVETMKALPPMEAVLNSDIPSKLERSTPKENVRFDDPPIPHSENHAENSGAPESNQKTLERRKPPEPVFESSSNAQADEPIIIDSDGDSVDKDVNTNRSIPHLEKTNDPVITPKENVQSEDRLDPQNESREENLSSQASSQPKLKGRRRKVSKAVWDSSSETEPQTSRPTIIDSDQESVSKEVDPVRAVPPIKTVPNPVLTPKPDRSALKENNNSTTLGAMPRNPAAMNNEFDPDNLLGWDNLTLEEATRLLNQLDSWRFVLNRYAD